jgi:multicomponent Na+:H+ antiporter subunit D
MPVTSATSLIASMSIAGIPPLNGFWSKLIIIIAAIQAHRYVYAFWAVLASILTLASFTKVMKYAFFGKLKDQLVNVKEVPASMRISMSILSAICLAGGLMLAPNIRDKFLTPALDVMTKGIHYSQAVLERTR